MTTILRLAAAAALLGVLSGCAGFMPNWQPNVGGESPAVYESSLSD